MRINGKEYQTIWFEKNVVKIIDQTKLPHQFAIKDLKNGAKMREDWFPVVWNN